MGRTAGSLLRAAMIAAVLISAGQAVADDWQMGAPIITCGPSRMPMTEASPSGGNLAWITSAGMPPGGDQLRLRLSPGPGVLSAIAS